MAKNVVLIDADSLCYLGKSDDTLQQIIEKVDYKIQAILDETKANYYCLFISKGKYFRHNLKNESEDTGSYKANRKYDSQPYKNVIKAYLEARWKAVSYPMVEADDIIAWIMNKELKFLETIYTDGKHWGTFDSSFTNFIIPLDLSQAEGYPVNVILAAIDKDLLQSIPGKHLNYNKKLGVDEWGMEWVETTKDDAVKFKKMQMFVGDASDGIVGIPGKGIKYWENVVLKDGTVPTMDTILVAYAANYNTVGQAIYEFQKNYRLLHLLDCDEDYLREVGYIPTLPEFQKVERVEEPEIKTEF